MSKNSQSFSRRLSRRIILAVLLNMSAITLLVFLLATAGMRILSKQHYSDILDITNEKVEKMLVAVEVSAANVVDEVEYWIDTPQQALYALDSELSLNTHLIGCGVGFIPDYYPSEGKWFEPYAIYSDGKVEVGQIGSSEHDYFKFEWYQLGLSSENGMWSSPYYDDAGAKAILCSYCLPVHNTSGEVAGALCADMSLEWLSEQLALIDKAENESDLATLGLDNPKYDSYSFIISKEGKYIVHPDRDRILNRSFFDFADSSSLDAYNELGQKMIAGEKGSAKLSIGGVKSYLYYAPIRQTGWSMAIVVPMASVLFPGTVVGIILLLIISLGLLTVFFICRKTIKQTSRPLVQLAASAEAVAGGNFDTPLPDIQSHDEIRQLRDSFENMEHSLTEYISRLTETTAKNAAIESELTIAREIQMSMLPKTFPPYPDRNDVDLFGSLTPAKTVGGDLYDFHIRDGHLFFCIGDVSGKGVPASIVMAVFSAQFRTLTSRENMPNTVLKEINDSIVLRNESMMFVTLFLGVLNLKTGSLHYCNAGHNAPVIADGEVGFLGVDPNVPVGVLPDTAFSLQHTTLAPGTTLFLYTDGLTEAENRTHEQFGEDRMIEVIKSCQAKGSSSLVASMSEAVSNFVDGAEQSDDLTMLAITFKGTV